PRFPARAPHRPPAVSPHSRPLALQPLIPVLWDAPSRLSLSPLTRRGTRGSSPDGPSAPKTLRCRLLNTFLNPPFGTYARPAPRCMDSAGTFLPSGLHASNTHGRLLRLRCRSLHLLPPQQDLVHYPEHILFHCSTVAQWAPFPPPAALRHSASCRTLECQQSFPSAHNDSEPDTPLLFPSPAESGPNSMPLRPIPATAAATSRSPQCCSTAPVGAKARFSNNRSGAGRNVLPACLHPTPGWHPPRPNNLHNRAQERSLCIPSLQQTWIPAPISRRAQSAASFRLPGHSSLIDDAQLPRPWAVRSTPRYRSHRRAVKVPHPLGVLPCYRVATLALPLKALR